MITIVGTGHVFNLAEPVSFIVKNTWPDAVLIELDKARYQAMMDDYNGVKPQGEQRTSTIYNNTAKYQQKMSQQNGSQLGSEFLAAVNTGKLLNAAIVPIDTDAMRVMNEMWEEMSRGERFRYRLSSLKDSFGGAKKVEETHRKFAANEQDYIEDMRRRYPTLVRKLIDERNVYMADQINALTDTYHNMVVVVGDAHVEGICALLKDEHIRKIRLSDIMDREKMNRIRQMIWDGRETLEG
ncbi:TraB family protein [methanogenic archaeon mixed culture ISO4-G1]|jgi:pheromone shutdown protein TraB|nr:TraB family protein [methanogenic archaeon mixed culture ISO4-G1]